MTTAGASDHNVAAMTKAMREDSNARLTAKERAWLKARRDRQLALVAGAEKSSRDFAIRTCTHCGIGESNDHT